jgi:acetyl-CoA synthetase
VTSNLGSYRATVDGFVWDIPEYFNIGHDVCDKWADGSGRLALIYETADGVSTRYSFDDLKAYSNQAAQCWIAAGLQAGERVGIFLPQSPETAICHIAAYKAGAIAVPLFTLFGVEALQFRLQNSRTRVLITDAAGIAKLAEIRASLPDLATVYCVDTPPADVDANADDAGSTASSVTSSAKTWSETWSDVLPFWPALAGHSKDYEPVRTRADDPAVIIYTSGTTGKPKGALHAHRVLLGHLPGVELSHDFFPQSGDLIWTPADWAWIGGLLDVLLPSLHHGIPVLARRFEKFNAAAVFELIARHQVRNMFLPPTALKMLRAASGNTRPPGLNVRTIASGGESLGQELLQWGRDMFGVTINEFYGQTECNMVVSSCGALFPTQPGSIGRAAPGHRVAIVDDSGQLLGPDCIGNIAIEAPDPVMFLGYWENEAATREKFAGAFLLTGDLGTQDAEGAIRFVGRNDDVITSAGYRIGPGPIEDCLLKHPAVAMVAVVGVPDAQRTEIVKAFIVLKPQAVPSSELVSELQRFVSTRVAAHEYPRAIEFVDSLPTTATGKIIRRELRERANE